ncbi:MAG: endolytic transglycosylase MltG [Andreesenia angusta]|nr:endolytic transglycosylase MltG [Andreesenia angusta]
MTRTLKAIISIVIVFTIVIAGTFFLNFRPVNSSDSEIIRVGIPQNSTTSDIGQILLDKGLIRNKLAFKILARTKKVAADLGTGTYDLSKSMNMNEIINKIASGEQTGDLKFTVPEGSEIVQMAEILKGLGMKDIDKFLELTKNPSNYISDYPFLNDIPKGASLEGYLYPATYYLTDEDISNPDAIIRMMLDNFSTHFTDEIIEAGKNKGLGINQIVTLASLVEREAQVDTDRPLVSAVFQNRIKKDMYLESCASVQYIIGERKPVLSLEDTDIDSPYNTYRNGGLPPSPIASPGVKSLEAAVHPADVDYLFFIAKGDGTHIFSSTFDEHLKVQKEIQNAD